MIQKVCDTDIFYEIIGQGFPVINIHGYGIDHCSMKASLEPLFADRNGFQRIYFDLPGMGRSGANPRILNSDDMLEVVMQFIDYLLPREQPFILTGLSYGGYLARGILHKMWGRVQALLLICPVVRFRRRGRQLPDFRLWERDDALVSALEPNEFETIDQFLTIQTKPVWERFKEEINPSLALADSCLMERIRDTEFSFDADSLETAFDNPALILLGRHDVAVGYKDAWKVYDNFSDATLVILGRCGHCLQMEQPDLFNAHVLAWLDQIKL
ncbi:MAG: alpha/beta hydrolase [Desulfobacteraceae bacterium]|nr:alpha/beta hydrolase [Desulfobacteraceae bacterium]